ncbi:MAG TPA: hypothetical protein VK983_04505 [Candidatus Limnocylindrales bacterium]|nr:hypothetical protein [Candidatus Limnocylindrales bacterium]
MNHMPVSNEHPDSSVNTAIPVGSERPAMTSFLETVHVLESYVIQPPRDDPYFSLFARGTLDALEREPDVAEGIQEAFDQRDIGGSYGAKLLLGEVQVECINDFSYPYNDSEAYAQELTYLLTDSQKRQQTIDSLATHELQSTVSERYKTLRLITSMYEERVGKRPTVFDPCSGLNHGLKQHAGLWPFGLVEVSTEELSEYEHAMLETEINVIIWHYREAPMRYGLGVDKQSQTPRSIARAAADSFYPGELKDPIQLERFHFLQEAQPEVVAFQDGVDMAEESLLPQTPAGGFDIGFISMALYQHDDAARKKILDNVRSNLADDGVLVVQEFAYPDSETESGLTFLHNWFSKEYPCQTMVFDMQKPNDNFQTLFEWTDGRITNMRPSELALELLARKPF